MSKRIVLLLVILIVASPLLMSKKKPKSAKAAAFDYYLLTLSWAPDFCAIPSNPQDPAECGKGKKVGFVVHGLWPQEAASPGPVCTPDGNKVPASIVNQMLKYMPTKQLIQHEWDHHGACSGLSMGDYFAATRSTRDSVKVPAAFQAPTAPSTQTAAQIEAAFAAANASFPATAFRAVCTNGTLEEARICFTKDLKPRACTVSAGECTSPMKILPVR